MPKADALFLLASIQTNQSDCTGLITAGWNAYAPVDCDIVRVDVHGAVCSTTDVGVVSIYRISNAIGAASARIASAMYYFSSAEFGSYGHNTVRTQTEPQGTSTTGFSTTSFGKHLLKGEGINIAVQTGGTLANIKGMCVQVWAQPKR